MRMRSAVLSALVASALAGFSASPVLAAPTVSANDTAGLFKVLINAGYDAELIADREPGDGAVISIDVDGNESFVLLSDCDEAVPEFCDTLVLSTAWDRETPMDPARVAEANRGFRYVSVWLDDEGDPYAQWPILTRRDGIAAPLFLNAVQRYLSVIQDMSEFVFVDDNAGEEAEPTS